MHKQEKMYGKYRNHLENKAINREYYKKHKERIRKYHMKYYQEHKEQLIEYKKKYNQNNKNWLQEYRKEYYKNRMEKLREYRKKQNDEMSIWFADFKTSMGCGMCGYEKWTVVDSLVFHHVNGEDKNIEGNIIKYIYLDAKKFQDYLDEFYKCRLLCKNCHDEVHVLERNGFK